MSGDPLRPLLARLALTARVFYSGPLCGWHDFDESEGVGHFHVVRSGRLRVRGISGADVLVDRPTLLFYPFPRTHQLVVAPGEEVDVLCASVDFGASRANPLLRGMPELMLVPLHATAELPLTVDLLFAEAFAERYGRQAAVDRLAEYLVIQLLRQAIETRAVDVGALAGLADPRLSRSITAIHDHPGRAWTLDGLAAEAGMSRARFAVRFRETVGSTPMEYLTAWRIEAACALLREGISPKRVAHEVGYASNTAFARVFLRRVGKSPARWLAAQGPGDRRVAGGD